MIFEAKQKILFAMYNEQHKDKPDMAAITPDSLQIDPVWFRVAVDRLENEGLIRGAVIIAHARCPIPRMVFLHQAELSPCGIRYMIDNLKTAI